MRLAEVSKDDDHKVFSYQDFMKLSVVKVKMSKDVFSAARSPKVGNWFHATRNKHQWEQVQDLIELGWDVVNGWRVTGRDFSGPDDRDGKELQAEAVVLTKPREAGCVVIFPSGHAEHKSSKTWKPTVEDFKKDTTR